MMFNNIESKHVKLTFSSTDPKQPSEVLTFSVRRLFSKTFHIHIQSLS